MKQESRPPQTAEGGKSGILAELLRQPAALKEGAITLLQQAAKKGTAFYEELNTSRLELAFASFDEEMRHALFEILFLLHVNDPSFADLKYTRQKDKRFRSSTKGGKEDRSANLFVDGAPSGIRGMDHMSPVFREPLEKYVQLNFGMPIPPSDDRCPIISISSGGSVGTIGHKSLTSDLDLNVQYDLVPFDLGSTEWSDEDYRQSLLRERAYWINREGRESGLSQEALQDPATRQRLANTAQEKLAQLYPSLVRHLLKGVPLAWQDLQGSQGSSLREGITRELILLAKYSYKLTQASRLKKEEALLKERVARIQDYISDKFPSTEVYLFPCSNDEYLGGIHQSTLESKESPGTAYGLLLNYETLMPGIQFTSMVPSHFLFSQAINDDRKRYDVLMDEIRFNRLSGFSEYRSRLTDLGPTPNLGVKDVARHQGGVYWESFKAASGNLPKATLNLLRIETLLEPNLLKTNIQLLKDPKALDGLITPMERSGVTECLGEEGDGGLPTWAMLELESDFPLLLRDPWWLRYKALKIGYCEADGVQGIGEKKRIQISHTIDMAFSLHLRMADVIAKPGDPRKFTSHREQVLQRLLSLTYPPGSMRRKYLEHVFIGEAHAVNRFEGELRELFKDSLARVNEKINAINVGLPKNWEEFRLWFEYYQRNFEPESDVVQRALMRQLKVPRGRLQFGYKEGTGWIFRSLQKESGIGKRFDTFGVLDQLPDEVDLHENRSFLGGLAHCILNGYYGTMNRGSLNERTTALEFQRTALDMGHQVHNTLAFIRPDETARIADRIREVFPYRVENYLDVIRLKREVTEVFVLLNLWKFGRLSVLYRDNHHEWRCKDFDHEALLPHAEKISHSLPSMLGAKPLHRTLSKFIQDERIDLNKVSLAGWVNPNSMTTGHASGNVTGKEKDLANAFVQVIKQVHGSHS